LKHRSRQIDGWAAVCSLGVPPSPSANFLAPAPTSEDVMSRRLTQRILVPVDGSQLAERILPLVERLSRDGAHVKLVRVVTNPSAELALKGKNVFGAAKGYLEFLAGRLRADWLTVSCALMVGDPAEEIRKLAKSWKPTLIAMSTHGRSGVARIVRGSVAERVLRECRFPLLLANPLALEVPSGTSGFRRILVPLDGSKRAAEIIPLASEIAALSKAEVVLFESTAKPSATQTTEDARRSHSEARTELEEIGRQLDGVPWRVLTTSREPANAIVTAIQREEIDLVAMTTHGRSGLSRLVFGSVAENVIRRCPCPLLVLRSSGAKKAGKRRAARARTGSA
jgi:nucleotide-binding universal stress UspA family protein